MEIIEKLQRSRPEIVHVFDEITRQMPDGVYLTAMKQTGTRLKFEGVAQSSHASVHVHAQHRRLELAEESRARDR